MSGDRISDKAAPYGYCPQCGAPGVLRERRPNGNDKCGNGHTYPSASSVKGAVSMTTETRVSDVLHGLVVQWRHNAQGCSKHEAHAAGTWRSCARDLSAALPLLDGGKGEPDGDYVMVPRVPTDAMDEAYRRAFVSADRFDMRKVWTDMLAAAPQPKAQQPAGDGGVDALTELVAKWRNEADEFAAIPASNEDRGYNNAQYQLADELAEAIAALRANAGDSHEG